MKTSRFTTEQIIRTLRSAEGRSPVAEMRHDLGVNEPTFCCWERGHLPTRQVLLRGDSRCRCRC